jgi:hypothetical protein
MSTRVPFILAVLAFCSGCGKQANSVSAPPSTPASASADSAAGGTLTDEARVSALLIELTQTARRYAAEQRRVPKTIEELVGDGYLTALPQAPRGKRFAINKNLQVYLANQ